MATPALPPCAQPGVSGGGLSTTTIAGPCGLALPIPKLTLPSLNLPGIVFPPQIPFPPKIGFQLSCDLNNPINITASLPPAALRVPCYDVSSDDADEAAAA